MTVRDFLASMVEAGIKADEGFEPGAMPAESAAELREQPNEIVVALEWVTNIVERASCGGGRSEVFDG